MKKILLTFGFCIGVLISGNKVSGIVQVASASGTNAVYAYFKTDQTPLPKAEMDGILDIEMVYKFPMSANPVNRAAVLPIIKRLCTQEPTVILEKIQERFSGIGLFSISCSQYELFVFDEYLEHSSTLDPRCALNLAFFPTDDVSAYYQSYPNEEEVKKRFWRVNNLILQFAKQAGWSYASLSADTLKKISRNLIDDLCAKFESDCSLVSKLFGCRAGFNFPSIFLKNFEPPRIACWSDYSRIKILQLLDMEVDTMTNPTLVGVHSVYRGEAEATSYTATDIGKVALSFGHGLFGGVIFDSQSGLPIQFALRGGRLVRLDLDKSTVISGICPVFMQPISSLVAVYGFGEKHHPRIKVLRRHVLDGKIPGAVMHTGSIVGHGTFDESYMPWLIEESKDFQVKLKEPVVTTWEVGEFQEY
jgi:hypothetical protein